MRIDGEKIAEQVRNGLKKRVGDLISHGITPKIAIITLGDESTWQVYVRRKIKIADELGIKAVLFDLQDSDESKLLKLIHEIENDPNFNGIIVQRPLPSYIDRQKVIEAVSPEKDIDGFHPDSKFEVPVWLAVKHILGTLDCLKSDLSYVVLGKGETAGGPIARGLKKLGIEPKIIDSQTQNREEILSKADVIISCVGKNVITATQIKEGVVLIGVGTHVENNNLKGDFEEESIKSIVQAYTPTPGGVGPVNLSYLFTNLVNAAQKE